LTADTSANTGVGFPSQLQLRYLILTGSLIQDGSCRQGHFLTCIWGLLHLFYYSLFWQPGPRGIQMSIHSRAFSWLTAISIACCFSGLNGQEKKQSTRPLFKVDVETVFVNVTVTDPLNRYVTGLRKEHFNIFEDKVEQDILHFGQQTAPITAGLIFDVSRSMGDNDNIRRAKNAVVRFMETGNEEDEYFLVTFNHKTRLAQTITHQGHTVQNEVAMQKPGGWTALYDAVYLGLDHVKRGTNEKKALILITDGEDNHSRYSPTEVREFAKESNVPLYCIGMEGRLGYGASVIQQLIAITGGRGFFPNTFYGLEYYIDLIHNELRNQYVLGYSPSNQIHDGKWRHIKVTLNAPAGLPKLIVHAREGYYAPPK
jgi:Ca-activated chloride channel homolog